VAEEDAHATGSRPVGRLPVAERLAREADYIQERWIFAIASMRRSA
jgi:hypothetical protein